MTDLILKQLGATAAHNLRATVEDLLRADPRIPPDVIAAIAEVSQAFVLELAACEGIPVAAPTDRTPVAYMDEADLKAFRELIREDQRGCRAFRELWKDQNPGSED
jgi:hypothetical protein